MQQILLRVSGGPTGELYKHRKSTHWSTFHWAVQSTTRHLVSLDLLPWTIGILHEPLDTTSIPLVEKLDSVNYSIRWKYHQWFLYHRLKSPSVALELMLLGYLNSVNQKFQKWSWPRAAFGQIWTHPRVVTNILLCRSWWEEHCYVTMSLPVLGRHQKSCLTHYVRCVGHPCWPYWGRYLFY